MTVTKKDTQQVVKNLSEEILEDLEIKQQPISQVLMKTKRLARLLHDYEALNWLNYEISGYPEDFKADKLGRYKKYFLTPPIWSSPHEKTITFSLPSMEAFIATTNLEQFSKVQPDHDELMWAMKAHARAVQKYEAKKNNIHNYVTDVHLALMIGEIAENIFDEIRSKVDSFIQENCPTDVKNQLTMIDERMQHDDPESYTHALTTARRVLISIADSIFPARDEPYIFKNGESHAVGSDNYINRILAYIDKNSASESTQSSLEAEINHLFVRFDTANNKLCKGVHDKVNKDEARLAIIQTYLLIAEIAKIQK